MNIHIGSLLEKYLLLCFQIWISHPDIQNIRVDQGYQCQPLDSLVVGIQIWLLNPTKSTNMFFKPSLHHRDEKMKAAGCRYGMRFRKRIWAPGQYFATSSGGGKMLSAFFGNHCAFIAAPSRNQGNDLRTNFIKRIALLFFYYEECNCYFLEILASFKIISIKLFDIPFPIPYTSLIIIWQCLVNFFIVSTDIPIFTGCDFRESNNWVQSACLI